MSSIKNIISTDLTDAKHAAEHAWLVHFRPVLRLLWPLVDFSDEVLAKLTLQGATEASHQPYQTALALMNFFRRRGIMELDGLSIFRDYRDDPDYKHFPKELDHICFFVAAKGGAALIKQVHCRYRPTMDQIDKVDLAEYDWLVQFRPVLQLLLPTVDFSNKVLAKLLQDAEPSHERFMLLNDENPYQAPYQTTLALMDFFRRRGIMDVDGLSIFRFEDFLEDPNCKHFRYQLDHICLLVAAGGSFALTKLLHKEICDRLGPAMDEIDKLACELQKESREPSDDVYLIKTIGRAISEENEVQGKQSERGHFDLNKHVWSLDAYLHFMSFLSGCPPSSGTMTMPLELVACSQQAQQCLENVLATHDYLVFTLDNKSELFSERIKYFQVRTHAAGQITGEWGHLILTTGNTLLERFPDAYDICLRAMVEGFSSREKPLESLTLNLDLTSFEDDLGMRNPFGNLDLTSFEDDLGMRNPFGVLFFRDNIACLHIEMYTWRLDVEPWADFERHCTPPKTSKKTKVNFLELSDLRVGQKLWKSMWNKVSELKHLEQIALDPRDNEWMTLDDISLALNSVCSLPKLVSLQLMATEVDETVDLTEVMLSLLDKGSIENIRVTGYKNRDYYSYEVNAIPLIERFKNNSSLRSIDLAYVKLTFGAHKDPTKMLLDALTQSNNSSLESIRLSDKSHVYAGPFTNAFRESVGAWKSYKNYKDARKIHYLTGLHKFGLAKIRAKSTQLPELVKLLSFKYYGADEYCYKRKRIVAIASEWGPDRYRNQGLEMLYRYLRDDLGSPYLKHKWFLALEEAAEHTSILYGLLHARPDLWCNAYSRYAAEMKFLGRTCGNPSCPKKHVPWSELKKCAACQSSEYCSRECQVAHWKKGHKEQCRKTQAARAKAGVN